MSSLTSQKKQEQSKQGSLLAAVPLKYTYAVKSVRQPYIYESSTGLWRHIEEDNHLVRSLVPQQFYNDFLIIDNFASMKPSISRELQESLTVLDSRANEHLLHIKIDAHPEDCIKEHLRLLSHYQKFDFKSMLVDLNKFKLLFQASSNNTLAPSQLFRQQLDELARFCNVEIIISTKVEYFNLSITHDFAVNNNTQNIYIYILGDSDDTIFAETRLRILMDDYLGSFVDSLKIPLSLIPLVGGNGFGNFKAIAKQTGVNLYLPSILPELHKTDRRHNLDTLFISGLESQVLLAKKLMKDVQDTVSKELFYKNIKILKFKKDYILINRKDELSAIMFKYGVFIQLSPLGYDDCDVHFHGDSAELIDLAVNDFNLMAHDIYDTSIWFHQEGTNDSKFEPADLKINEDELKHLICKISVASNTLIYASYKVGSYKVTGSQEDSLKAVKLFKSYANQFYGDCSTNIKFSIELGLSYHEFISGKKNGKISKIINGSQSTLINFSPLNEHSLLIDFESSNFNDFLNSFAQLQNEFPSEFKFYIPESFHRQIIGTGGSLIQSIMRKYNVFVKFSNSYDLKNNSKSPVRYDNVIIRCPFKNSSNIPLVKSELNSLLINNENVTFFNTYLKISRNQYRLFNFNKIQEIEKKTSTFIKFPATEPVDFAIVEVLGTDTQSINATRTLISELAEGYEFKITWSSNFHKVVNDNSESFIERIRVPFKLLYNFEIQAIDSKSSESGPYHSIVLSYLPESNLFLEDAITHLTTFVREFKFMIIDRGELSNNDLMINGSASRYSVMNTTSTDNKKFNSSSVSSSGSNLPAFSSAPTSSMSFTLPQSQQLYQLPNLPSSRYPMSQPTLVQPLGIPPTLNAAFPNNKRPSTYNGYDTNNGPGNGKSYQRRY